MRELFSGRNGRVAVGLLVAEFVAATQGLVVAAIMPRVVADLHGLASYPLAFGAFFASFVLFMPFAGPWADRFGARRMLAISLSILALGLALVAVSPNMAFFAVARFVEGIGDGMDYAVTFAIVAKTFTGAARARMLSINAGMWVVPSLFGPALGAFVAVAFGWRWAFASFLPLVLVAALLLVPVVDDRPSEERTDPLEAFRLLFSLRALRARDGIYAVLAAYAFVNAAFMGADAYIPLMLTQVRGISLQLASLCITLGAFGWSGASLTTPALRTRFGVPAIVGAGAAGCIGGSALLIAVSSGAVPVAFAFCGSLVGGFGIGLAYPTLSDAALSQAPEGREGGVSSATLLAGIFGVIAGVLLCGAPVAYAAHGALPLRSAMMTAFAISGALGAAILVYSRRLQGQF